MALYPHAARFFGRICLRLRDGEGIPEPDSPWHMGPAEASRRIVQIGECLRTEEAEKLAAVALPTLVYLYGGEPFFRVADLEQTLACARTHQMYGEIATGVTWVENPEQVRAVFEKLNGMVRGITIQTSRQALEAGGIERLAVLLRECRLAGILASIRCFVGPDSPFPRELLALEDVNSQGAMLVVAPEEIDAGQTQPPAGYLLETPPLRRRCADLFDLVVVAGGDCYPCLAGAGLDGLCLGSIEREPVLDVLRRATGGERYRRLREEGPYSLFELARRSEAAGRLSAGYVDACHFHRHVLRDPLLRSVAASPMLDRDGDNAPVRFPIWNPAA